MAAIVSALLGGSTAPAAVRKPVFAAEFGGNADSVISITIEAGLAPLVAAAMIDGLEAAPGASGSVKLGYDDEGAKTVFTGAVQSVRRRIAGVRRVTAVSKANAAARLRVNQSYEKQKAGDVVKDLAGRVGLGVETVRDGIDLPFYAVDDGRTAWAHVADLARLCGYLAYVTPDDEVHFGPFSAGEAVQTFAYGADILAMELAEEAPPAGKVKAVGEGAAGSQGSDAWNWLIKDPAAVSAESGDGAETLLAAAALRSTDAARMAAAGASQAAGWSAAAGVLVVPGAPKVTAGSIVEITGAPEAALNGKCLVRWLRHRYSKTAGFISVLGISNVGAGAGAAGGLLSAVGGLL